MRSISKRARLAGLLPALALWSLSAQAQAMTHFDLPAQSLSDSLRAIGSLTNTNILFNPPLVAGLRAPAVKADLTTEKALAQLLQGTGIHFEFLNDHTIVLAGAAASPRPFRTAAPAEPVADPIATQPQGGALVAQAEPAAASDLTAVAPAPAAPPEALPEVMVTGSRIARKDFVSEQPIVTSSAADLKASAKLNVETALEQMPQFQNGQDENYDAGAVGGGGRATVNLRGLGQQRTLVLLDGRRLPPTDGTGVADLNDVPLGIIDNVQVISGGASAAYGSDAMAGVVNIITKNVNGLEISVSHGAMDGGIGKRNDFSLNAGSSFGDNKGHAMISFE